MKFDKKGLTYGKILSISIIIVTLIVLFGFTEDALGDWFNNVDNDVYQCSQIFKSINGEEVYFDKLSQPTEKFNNAFKNYCPSQKVEVDSDSVYEAVEIVNNCWKKFGSGHDFLGANSDNANFCFYCGKMEVVETVSDFKNKFWEIAEEKKYELNSTSTEIVNLNDLFLKSSSLDDLDDGEYYVMYYVHKDASQNNDWNRFYTATSKMFSNLGGITTYATYYLSSSNLDTRAGVIISKDSMEDIKDKGCYVYIPIDEK